MRASIRALSIEDWDAVHARWLHEGWSPREGLRMLQKLVPPPAPAR